MDKPRLDQGPDYERGFIDGMMYQTQSSVDKAVNAMTQPKQEPVPTLEDIEQEIYQNTRNFVSRDVMEWMLRRYYTHPPQRTWVGLTNEERYLNDSRTDEEIEYAKAIEAKLKDKNT